MRAGRINYDDIVFYLVNVTRAQAVSPSHFPIIINYRIDCIMHARCFIFKARECTILTMTKIEAPAFFCNAHVLYKENNILARFYQQSLTAPLF